jgi:primosomal protein N' (replication factor Y)
MKARVVHPRHGAVSNDVNDVVVAATKQASAQGGALLVIPPALSALTVVSALAESGSVLVVCPTQRMAHVGAAFLRRKGLVTAEIPDEWDNARAGVDVVIGARSAVFAPCAELSAIVVIDEHDESLHEERAPTWNAAEVATERARLAGVPIVLTSAVPSLGALVGWVDKTIHVDSAHGWPKIEIVDLASVPVAGSLLSTELLTAISTPGATTACVLNTKGKARLIVCKSCRKTQNCSTCLSLLTQLDDGTLFCSRCEMQQGGVCVSCGRSAFLVPRGGVTQLTSQVQASSANPVIEVTSDSDESWTKGNVFIGTEAVLYRVPQADCVVFADIDRDLGAPRMSAPVEVAAIVARAARMVGANGKVVIQSRVVDHPLLVALASNNVVSALQAWRDSVLAQRRALGLPPYSCVARITLTPPHTSVDIPELESVLVAREEEAVLLRATHRDDLEKAITQLRAKFGAHMRVHVDPLRY